MGIYSSVVELDFEDYMIERKKGYMMCISLVGGANSHMEVLEQILIVYMPHVSPMVEVC